jgi:hypothetical protein
MSKNDDEFNEFLNGVTDGVYNLSNLSCVEVIFKLVEQIRHGETTESRE